MFKTFLLACLLWIPLGAVAQSVPSNTGNCLNTQEAELARLVNEYRAENGLGAIDVSLWLSATGQWHAWDLTANNPGAGSCGMHSWSGARPLLWNATCYASSSASTMWNKPKEISANLYPSNGYENAAWGGDAISAATALAMWKNSPPHVDVILNRGIWTNQNWRGLGVGIVGGYAVLWFGTRSDPTAMAPCTSGGSSVDQVYANTFE